MLRAIDHVQIAIPVGGEDQARPFYGDLLGLTEVPKPAELAKRGGAHTVFIASSVLMLVWLAVAWNTRYVRSAPDSQAAGH